MRLSYRTRQFYRRLFRVLLALVLAAVILVLCWSLWLRRFIVYTADGVRLNFQLEQNFPQGQVSQQAKPTTVPNIYFTETQPSTPPITEEDPHFSGFYVTVEELLSELDAVLVRIQALPEDTPVMLDVKGYWGYFYYSSDLGDSSKSFDAAAMDGFFAAAEASGVHLIARLPAFRDYDFASKNISCGLKTKEGYLWVDADRCYWLDPANEKVLNHLVQITEELRDMGFDEVAFTNFCFPGTEQVVYEGDRQQILVDTAAALASTCARDDFAVSFISTDPTFPLPDGNCRLYLQDVAAADVQTVLMLLAPGVMERTVFFTQSNDTRFESCGVIRPLVMAE